MASRHTEETKAAAMAALLTGQSVSGVAREYKLPKGTVSDWRRSVVHKVQTGEPAPPTTLDDLLLDYVRENLITLCEQAKVFRDSEWIKKQPASSAAILYGVIADKTIRLLEAMAPGHSEKD
jgi:transposase-like protein